MKINSSFLSETTYDKDIHSTKMLDIIIALMPALIAGAYFFGYRAILIPALCIVFCVLFDYLWCKIFKTENTAKNLSAVVMGFMLGFNMPSTAPVWICPIASFFIIVFLKKLLTNIAGKHYFNYVLFTRLMLTLCFTKIMSTFAAPFTRLYFFTNGDAIVSKTPLAYARIGENIPAINSLFFGNVSGLIGETSVLAILIGGIYLLFRKIISWEIPVSIIISTALFSFLFSGEKLFTGNWLFHILAGGVIFGAVFFASVPDTAPKSFAGRIIYGILCGGIIMFTRLHSSSINGVMYAILIANILSPLIDKCILFTKENFSKLKANPKRKEV